MQKIFDTSVACLFSREADLSMPMRIAAPGSRLACTPYFKLAGRLSSQLEEQQRTHQQTSEAQDLVTAIQSELNSLEESRRHDVEKLTEDNASLQKQCAALAQEVRD